jgi:hypothetical protein
VEELLMDDQGIQYIKAFVEDFNLSDGSTSTCNLSALEINLSTDNTDAISEDWTRNDPDEEEN